MSGLLATRHAVRDSQVLTQPWQVFLGQLAIGAFLALGLGPKQCRELAVITDRMWHERAVEGVPGKLGELLAANKGLRRRLFGQPDAAFLETALSRWLMAAKSSTIRRATDRTSASKDFWRASRPSRIRRG